MVSEDGPRNLLKSRRGPGIISHYIVGKTATVNFIRNSFSQIQRYYYYIPYFSE